MTQVIKQILVVGDSWASAIVAGNPQSSGWPEFLGIPSDLRQGIAGSTAVSWAANEGGRLTLATATPADVVIVSLLGNDAIAAMADGSVSPQEVAAGVQAFRNVIKAVRKPRTIVILYADPFQGKRADAAVACQILNAGIRLCCPDWVEFLDTTKILKLDHFDGSDIHPNQAGHETIAAEIKKMVCQDGF